MDGDRSYPGGVMNPFVAMATASIMLAGVSVQVSSSTAPTPKDAPVEHPEVLISTRDITPGASVVMSNDDRWSVKSKSSSGSGIRVTLVPPANSPTQIVLVPVAHIDTPIWWVGQIVEQEGENPGEPTTGEPGDPGPNTTPQPPAPTEPPVPDPTEPPVPPFKMP